MRQAILAGLFWAATMGGAAAADGAQLFDTNCAFCHQQARAGVAGQFPRLSGRVGVIASKPQGKAFLPQILLNGMSGRITVDGQAILGIMPAFDSLSDEDIAAVLTYLSGLEHAPVEFSADEIKQARSQPRVPPTEVAAQRDQLSAAKIVP